MPLFRLAFVAVCVLVAGLYVQNAFAADNGVVKLELADAAAAGMGDAFVGEADRPSAVYYNPAGMTQMDRPEFSAGLTLLQPQIEFESSTPDNGDTSNMKRDNYLFPDVFFTTPLGNSKFDIGVGEASDFGSGNDWAANSFSRYDTIKDSIVDMDYMLSAAYKIDDQWSLGLGVISDDVQFEHDSALYQGTGFADGNALFKANDDAWGYQLGSTFRLNAQNQFGLTYKSPIHHAFDGTLYLSGLNHGGYDYETIFGGTSFSTEAIQKFTMPQSVTLGYSTKPINKLTVNFDLEWTDWSQYKQQTTYYPNVTNPSQLGVLGTGNPQNREWHSVWSESLGLQYEVTDKFRVRTGYEHHQTPVPESTFDTEFPDSDANAVTFGIGYDITSRLTVDIAYVADFYESRNVVNTVSGELGPLANPLSGKYKAFVNIGTVSFTYKF